MPKFKYDISFLINSNVEKVRISRHLNAIGYAQRKNFDYELPFYFKSYGNQEPAYQSLPTSMNPDYLMDASIKAEYKAGLAIASIHQDDNFHVGEWVKVVERGGHNSSHKWFTRTVFENEYDRLKSPEFFIIQDIDENEDRKGERDYTKSPIVLKLNNSAYRANVATKATPEELIELFKEKYPNMQSQSVNGPEKREIIGYRIIKDGPGFTKGLELTVRTDIKGGDRGYQTPVIGGPKYRVRFPDEVLIDAEWFEPIYKNDIVTELYDIGSNGVRVAISSDKSITARGSEIKIEELRQILYWFSNPRGWGIGGWLLSYPKEGKFIRVGCQEENNLFSLNDIELIVNSYNHLNP